MSSASSMKTSCAFNTFIQQLPSAAPFRGTLEGSKNHDTAKPQQRPKIFRKLRPISLLSHVGKIFEG
jgi:hypothetical protein